MPSEPDNYYSSADQAVAPEEDSAAGDSIDELLQGKTDVLHTRLNVLAAAIGERLRLRQENFYQLLQDECRTDNLLHGISVQTGYNFDDGNQKAGLYQQLFDLEKQRRGEDTNCWRDVVMVLRDFLETWEAVQHAKSRTRLLNQNGSEDPGRVQEIEAGDRH